mgnify:CR=1 FL=1
MLATYEKPMKIKDSDKLMFAIFFLLFYLF